MRQKSLNRTIFAGTAGVLATSFSGTCNKEPEEVVDLLNKDLPLERIANLSFMFNFHEVRSLGNQKLCVQLADALGRYRYTSDWSRGFSLDSVGVSQVIG